jgi:hypothetical protein
LANGLKEAIQNRDYKAIETIAKKPLFSFLDVEIVKSMKKLALNPPD